MASIPLVFENPAHRGSVPDNRETHRCTLLYSCSCKSALTVHACKSMGSPYQVQETRYMTSTSAYRIRLEQTICVDSSDSSDSQGSIPLCTVY